MTPDNFTRTWWGARCGRPRHALAACGGDDTSSGDAASTLDPDADLSAAVDHRLELGRLHARGRRRSSSRRRPAPR